MPCLKGMPLPTAHCPLLETGVEVEVEVQVQVQVSVKIYGVVMAWSSQGCTYRHTVVHTPYIQYSKYSICTYSILSWCFPSEAWLLMDYGLDYGLNYWINGLWINRLIN